MKAVFHVNQLEHQIRLMRMIQESMLYRGISCFHSPIGKPYDADIIFVWSWKHPEIIENALVKGSTIVYVERGFLPDRTKWTSLSVGGFNNRGRFLPPQDKGDRADEHFRKFMKPWTNDGDRVLVAGQHPMDVDLYGMDVNQWAYDTYKHFPKAVYRPHPRATYRNHLPMLSDTSNLQMLLKTVYRTITYSSTIAVESVLEGTPTVALDKGSVAWDVCSHDIDVSETPDREKWLIESSWKQWSNEELKNPSCPIYDFIISEASK